MAGCTRIEIPSELVSFFRELYEAHCAAAGEAAITVGNTENLREKQLAEAVPLIDLCPPTISPDQYMQQFRQTGAVLVRHRSEKEVGVSDAVEVLQGSDLSKLIRDLCQRDNSYMAQLVEKAKDGAVLQFVAENALKPFLMAFSSQVKDCIDRERWGRFHCPACGRTSNFSRLQAEDGRRLMYCQYCGLEWNSRYLGCSRCGNDDHKSLSYLTPEDSPALQVFVCKKCKGYLKTYDERKGKDCPELALADILTLHLDLLAEREGYSNQVTVVSGLH